MNGLKHMVSKKPIIASTISAAMPRILMYSPRQWDLQWGQEKDLINILNTTYAVTLLEFPDYMNLKSVYPAPKHTHIIYRKTHVKPGVSFGIFLEWSNLNAACTQSYDTVVTYLTAGSTFASIAAKIRGKKVILIYADDLPEIHKRSSHLSALLTKYFFNPVSALFADKIIVTAKLLARDIDHFGKEPIYIPNGVHVKTYKNTNMITKKPQSHTNHDLHKSHKLFTLGFVGGFGHWVNFDLLIDYAKKNPQVNVILVGDGEQFSDVNIKCRELKNVKFTGMVSKEEVKKYIALMDACIIPFKIMRLTDRVSPIKLFEYWALGKPVISTRCYEIMQSGKDTVLYADTLPELERVMHDLIHDIPFRKRIIKDSLQKVKQYDWDVLGKKYIEVFSSLEKK